MIDLNRLKNILSPLFVTVFAILGLVMGFYLSIKLFLGDVKKVEVPDLVGLTVDQALEETALLELGLKLEARRALAGFKPGEVVNQRPVAGRVVKKGRNIFVTITKENEKTVFPEVVGKRVHLAKQLLETKDIDEIIWIYGCSTRQKGIVLDQDPDAGTLIAEKITRVLVSSGPCRPTVLAPELKGLNAERVRAEFSRFNVETIFETVNSKTEPGLVVSQYPSEGTPLIINDLLKLQVSGGLAGLRRHMSLVYIRQQTPYGFFPTTVSITTFDSQLRQLIIDRQVPAGRVLETVIPAAQGVVPVVDVAGASRTGYSLGVEH